MATTFNKFIPTTVFDLKIYAEDDIEMKTVLTEIESLKVANFTQEGPTKTARGGKNNAILARYGKETRLEMEDALISVEALKHLIGAEVKDDTIQIRDTFPKTIRLVGTTFFIDDKGEKIEGVFTVPHFSPDGLLNLTMEAEGDFGVLEIGGEVFADKCGNFYTIGLGVYSCGDDTETGEEEEEEEGTEG